MVTPRAERPLVEAVAEAADAWLRDPRDVNVYAHLVAAVETLRAYRAGRPYHQAAAPAGEGASPQGEELLDALADVAPTARVGDLIQGAPQEVLARLRGAVAATDGDARS